MEGREGLRSEIGRGLQWLRKSLGQTQYQLAALAQLDYRHYQNIETGRVEVKVETLKRICDALGVVLSAFFAILDRRPWLIERPARNKRGGDLYVFRIEHEHAKFQMFDEVRQTLNDFGRDLSEGNRENLTRCPFPCFEIDRSGRCLWKNTESSQIRLVHVGGSLHEVFADADEFGTLMREMEELFSHASTSIYRETRLHPADGDEVKHAALIAFCPLNPKDSPSLFFACIDLSHRVLFSRHVQRGADLSVIEDPRV